MKRILQVLIASVALGQVPVVLHAACGKTTFHPVSPYVPSNEIHQAFYLQDPAGQQKAIFDLEWGGVLASLKQGTTERVWGHATGGMVQPTWHSYPTGNGQDYNPTPAGDGAAGNRGTPVIAARCLDSNALYIVAGTTDYNAGRSGRQIANVVKKGDTISSMWATPYVVVTTATFVSNPSGPPSYYLKLTHRVTNFHDSENLPWGFELAGYVPYNQNDYIVYPAACTSFASNCLSSTTPTLVAGLYPTTSYTNGTAFFISPQDFHAPTTNNFASFGPDDVNQNQSTHIFNAYWTLGPGQTKVFTWYVLAGDWNKALAFAQAN